MAEHMVEALADRVISTVAEYLFQEISLVTNFRKDLEYICDELDSIKCLLNDAGVMGSACSNSMRNWLRKLQDFLYDALQILEECSSGSRSHEICCSTFLSRYRMGRDIRVLRKRLAFIHHSAKYFKYLKDIDARPRLGVLDSKEKTRKSSSLLIEAGSSVGIENDIHRIVEWLLAVDSSPFVAVVGMGGLGKTLLLQHVFDSQNVKSHFDHLIWVAISPSFVLHQLLLHIARSINLADAQQLSDLSEEELKEKIHKHLRGSRSLLVLDDVWDKSALRCVCLSLEDYVGNKVVITSRYKRVSEGMGALPHRTHQMEYLSEDNSWKLFCIHAFPESQDHNPPQELYKVARSIERKCSRLPLAVKTTAASMASVKRLPNEWESRLRTLKAVKDDVLPILKLSYDTLPDYLKPCFLICCAFPQGSRMGCQYLVQIWIAEGFVCPAEDGEEDPYDVGYSYLKDLVDRCMLESVPDASKEEDTIKYYCRIHDLLHELALSESHNDERCLFQAGRKLEDFPVEKCHGMRRISLIKNEITSMDKVIPSPGLRTLLLWNNLHLKSICEEFFDKLKHLRVLDLSQTSVCKLPKSIGNLINLRLLNLSRTNIRQLPRCLSRFRSLLFLDVSWCSSLKHLHPSIHKNQSILNLNIEGCQNLESVPWGISKLLSLRILKGVVFKQETSVHERPKTSKTLQLIDLNVLTRLQRVSITFSGGSSLGEGIFGGMDDMRRLFLRNSGDFVLQLPEDMASMSRLEVVHLQKCSVPTWIRHLENLTVLLLKGDDSANYEGLSLESIPNLTRLVLFQNQRCIALPREFGKPFSFPKLESLTIEDFHCLEAFPTLEDNAMRMLKVFRLANCVRLHRLPEGLGGLHSLEDLQLGWRNEIDEEYFGTLRQRNVKIKVEVEPHEEL